jgi:hypothetical protein
MDKQLLKAYIRTIVEEEIERVLPKMIKEYIEPLTKHVVTESTTTPKSTLDRGQLAAMLGLTRDGDTISATTSNIRPGMPPVAHADVPPDLNDILNRDYSSFMKKVDKISKNK